MLDAKSQPEFVGLIYGFIGVVIFSLTLPATRLAVTELDPVFVGLGRAILAAALSLVLLIITRQKIPPWKFLPQFAVVVGGVIIGFPLLSAIAMQDASASHGAVITGLMPLATAICGVWRGKEKVSLLFWIFALMGSSLVIIFALMSGAGRINLADIALLGAVVTVGIGYAEGA
jgi:drug/metabolite transporter (DMT)-like permease